MSFSRFPGQGPAYVPAYQVSGTPFVKTVTSVSTTAVKISFPGVTRWVIVSAQDDEQLVLRVGFSENGVDANPSGENYYYRLDLVSDAASTENFIATTPRLELRCKEIFLRSASGTISNVSIIAGVTGIEEFPILSGSKGFKGIG